MPPRKRLSLSAYCEAVAKKCAKGDAVPADDEKTTKTTTSTAGIRELLLNATQKIQDRGDILASLVDNATQNIQHKEKDH